jgi:hypothetical protein
MHAQVFRKADNHEAIEIDDKDGTFFIPFKEWIDRLGHSLGVVSGIPDY